MALDVALAVAGLAVTGDVAASAEHLLEGDSAAICSQELDFSA